MASTLGVLGAVSKKYAAKIPFIVKLNHNEFLSYPNSYDQIIFASVKQAVNMGAAGVGATIYFGSPESKRQIQEVSVMFQQAHENGLFTVLWCYTRNASFKTKEHDYHLAADLTGQANHLGVTIEADIIKQKLPEVYAGGYTALNFGKTHKSVYEKLTTATSDRYDALSAGELLHGTGAAHQLRRRLGGGERSQGSREDGGHQQARWRIRPDLWTQGVPAADEGRRRDSQRHPGRLPGEGNHDRVGLTAKAAKAVIITVRLSRSSWFYPDIRAAPRACS